MKSKKNMPGIRGKRKRRHSWDGAKRRAKIEEGSGQKVTLQEQPREEALNKRALKRGRQAEGNTIGAI